ncbi:ogr/Delta-like zinc finger family protein [Burkholderia ubonensis]|uniref:ogr/Delta-like zinc finger family protein n=1 Tax=Burkholderia ubonensis TaxID=101571 RepID=UPI000B23E777
MRFTIACPHCGARGIARSLEQKAPLAWEIDYQCDNVVCGHTYRARLEMTPAEPPPRTDGQMLLDEARKVRALRACAFLNCADVQSPDNATPNPCSRAMIA